MDQAAFTAFTTHFTADECLPFIINKKSEHPYFFKPDKLTKQTIDIISFDPRLITENNLIDDNRPYRYEQNSQEQQSLFTNNKYYNENDNNNEDYTLENQTENRNEIMVHHINENTSEYTTPESTTSAQDASQAGTSTNNHLVRAPNRFVSPRPITYDPQSYSDTSPRRNITFNFPSNSDDEIQEQSQNITSFRNTFVDVSSPTRTILDDTQNINTTQNITRSMYDPPSLPSTFKYPNKTIRSENNNNQQISSRYYDPFNYSFYPQSDTIIQSNDDQNSFQFKNNPNVVTHHSHSPYQEIPHKQTLSQKTKEYHILTLYNLLKDDFKILYFHIYLPTPYIK